jgi:hypothetical protein
MPINYSIRDWHGSDNAPNTPEPIRLRNAIAGLLDAQSVSISLATVGGDFFGFWRSPGYEVEVTAGFVSAHSNITSDENEFITVRRGVDTTIAEAVNVQGKAIANAMLAMTNGTLAGRTVPADTLVRVESFIQGDASGGGGLTVHLTFKPTGN